MKTMYDLRQLLKRYGIFVYTGNRIGDVELIEEEVKDLYRLNMIDTNIYQQAILLLRAERRHLV